VNIKDIQRELEEKLRVKVTQTALGKALGISKQRINQIAKEEISSEQYNKILNYFNLNKTKKLDKKSNSLLDIPAQNAPKSCGISAKNKDFVYQISAKLADDLGLEQSSAKIFHAQGNSMEPLINPGDTLLVDLSKKEISDGKIYYLKINNLPTVKRLQFIPPNFVNIVSENNKYKSYELKLSDIEIIGEVIWKSTVLI